MDFSEKLIKSFQRDADEKLALVCRLLMGCMILAIILNSIGIFKLNKLAVNLTGVLAIFHFFLPTLFYDILKMRHNGIRYFILMIIVMQCGIFYIILSYHAILLFALPVVISCLYNESKYVKYTLYTSVPVMIIAHLVAYQLKIVPDEPLVTLKGVCLYGILPRAISLLAIGIVCLFISERIEKLLQVLVEKNNELYEDQNTLITSFSQIIEEKSQTTGHHVKRVAKFVEILCRGLGYSEEDTWKISLAAMMHDVGKLMIPTEILEKPGRLTDEEFEIIKGHVHYGKRLLEKSPGELMKISTEIAYQHHEKWNGRGYLGLQGEEISIYARCVAVADVFDALVSKRPYKRAWTPEEAYEEIITQKGEQFAPEVVEVFIAHFNEFLEVLSEYSDEEIEE